MTRRNKEREPKEGWYPNQCLTPEESLRGYTSWGAYAAHEELETGILAPGRKADVTVMDLDPFVIGEEDPGALLSGNIEMTIVAGTVVHERNDHRSDH